MLPHGGPWARDVWVFDPLVQFLANRGYAVLQMNYRGSIGYGREFSERARREIGRGIQNDIEDATRWAIDKGVADPQRVAILGASYGGYSTLFALGKNPELYRCGISIAGVSDWMEIMRGKSTDEYKLSYEHWVEQIGDPKVDHDFMESISPVTFADKITAPLLIIQGKEDRVVPPKQARLMISALEKAGVAFLEQRWPWTNDLNCADRGLQTPRGVPREEPWARGDARDAGSCSKVTGVRQPFSQRP